MRYCKQKRKKKIRECKKWGWAKGKGEIIIRRRSKGVNVNNRGRKQKNKWRREGKLSKILSFSVIFFEYLVIILKYSVKYEYV